MVIFSTNKKHTGKKKGKNCLHEDDVQEKNVCGKNSSSSEKKAWKKIQACTGYESMTSAIPVHYSTNWAKKPTGCWSSCWFQINPWSGE